MGKININSHIIMMISKLEGKNVWHITSNPRWCRTTKACNEIMCNVFNDYAEYKNCGSLHRMIRVEDCNDYGINEIDIKPEFTLNPAEAKDK